MISESVNIYEQAFACWLREQKIAYESVVQTERVASGGDSIKNFDFVLRPDSSEPVLVELKGRTFHGRSLAGLRGLDSWVTFEDVEALSHWLSVFARTRAAARAVFVFVFRLELPDVENDGVPIHDYEGRRYVMFFIELQRYRELMKCRSPKWQTVTLAAEHFRNYAKPVGLIFAAEATECSEIKSE
ncbi:MAG: HYExAFE family protein [Planctomycetaceae bacterium]|nr:HYExAFE family protein [Planctomycetaceae bacterium]